MGYFGLGTKENKIAWTCVAVFLLLGIAFWIPGVLQFRKCNTRYVSCLCRGERGALQCLTAANAADQPRIMQCRLELQQCRKTPIIIWALGWLFLVGFSWVPCFYFCCCAKDPRCAAQGGMYTAQGVQMATGQPYGPAAHYTTHPFATQQYGPMPYYTGQQQQQQQACPAPAYPAAPPPMGYPVHPQQQQQQQGAPGQVPVNRY